VCVSLGPRRERQPSSAPRDARRSLLLSATAFALAHLNSFLFLIPTVFPPHSPPFRGPKNPSKSLPAAASFSRWEHRAQSPPPRARAAPAPAAATLRVPRQRPRVPPSGKILRSTPQLLLQAISLFLFFTFLFLVLVAVFVQVASLSPGFGGVYSSACVVFSLNAQGFTDLASFC
jgi:hypothetical protein